MGKIKFIQNLFTEELALLTKAIVFQVILLKKLPNFCDFENPCGHLNPPEAFGPGSPLTDPTT